MYKLYYGNIDLVTDSEYETALASLCLDRRKEIEKKKDILDKKRSLTATMLTIKALKEFENRTDEPIIVRGSHGKPYALNYASHFNASHSGRYVVVVVSDKPIGVDIEVIREYSAAAAAKFLNDDEKNYIVLDDVLENKQERFYKLWTAKEAYLKLIGTGLSGGIETLHFRRDGDKMRVTMPIKITYDRFVKGAIIAIAENA